ncbi:pinin isoform X2 [Drosophila sechellia]|uniref:pinin isoform X2 n=1 Tax=Drosophila sechellia TaxID=7238 RepID=UPI0013DE246A|nr:pinin isoform X2 [Drosophila sechellia]
MVNDSGLSTVDDLEQKLNSAKQSLVILNENIRRIAGRVPKDSLQRSEKFKYTQDGKRNEHNGERPFPRNVPPGGVFKDKRRMYESKNPNSRFPIEENEGRPPRINSRVIREMPTKKEIVEAQGTDSESRARNRRMFGSLLGTLQKFCQEESRLKSKEDKKAEIDRKVEKQELQERAMLRKQRETLFLDRKKKQFEIRRLEYKMARMKDFKVWEATMLNAKSNIRTKTKPHLFFRPKVHSPKTEKLLSKSKSEADVFIEFRREELEVELKNLENMNFGKMEDDTAIDESFYEEHDDEEQLDKSSLYVK